MKTVTIKGRKGVIIEVCDCETDDRQLAFNAAQQSVIQAGVDPMTIYRMECDDVVMIRYDTCIQIFAPTLNKEYMVDGYVLADSPQLARNVCQLQANAIIDEIDNKKWKLQLIGIAIQPCLESVN